MVASTLPFLECKLQRQSLHRHFVSAKVTHLFDVAKFSEKNSRKKIALKAPLLSTGNCKISDLSKKDNFREFKIEFFSRPTVRN